MKLESNKPTYSRDSNWFTAKTKCEKKLLILCILIFLISIALLISVIVVANQTNELNKNVCSTPGCIRAASDILKNIDTSKDPCDDFYSFACGKFITQNTIPEDKDAIGAFYTLSDVILNQLRILLEEPLQESSSKPRRLIKTLYDICMNTTAIEINGASTHKSIIKELGGWPLLEGSNWNENLFDWKQTMYKFRKHGFSTNNFLSLFVCTDQKNSTKRVLCLDQATLHISTKFLIEGMGEKHVNAYYEYKVDIAEYFGANRGVALKELKDTVEFEIKLAKICIPKEDRKNLTASYNPMTIHDLHRDYPIIPWLEYFTKILDTPGVKLTEEDIVIVFVPNYLKKLDALIRQTPKRVLSNYLMTNLILSTISFLNEKYTNRHQQFKKIMYGSSGNQPRWKECASQASGSLHLASGSAYAKRFFNMKVKEYSGKMFTNIQDVFINNLKTLNWMDPSTKVSAIEKAESIAKYMAFPNELLDDKQVDAFYFNLEINTDDFLKSSRAVSLFYEDYRNSRLRESVNKTDWRTHCFPTKFEADYKNSDNSIEFPAGILLSIYFNADRPHYLNYGGIGSVMGHEITHGFDDLGRHFDKNGNHNNWWHEATNAAFIKNTQCIIDQYGNYTIPGIEIKLNGTNSLQENIADNGGIKLAYIAYNNWVEQNGPESQLPSLKYTPHQLFWIWSANLYCIKEKDDFLKLIAETGYYAINSFRVNGPLSNSIEFANDFKCISGSRMNPQKKCAVW